jgi:hypothetical protein
MAFVAYSRAQGVKTGVHAAGFYGLYGILYRFPRARSEAASRAGFGGFQRHLSIDGRAGRRASRSFVHFGGMRQAAVGFWGRGAAGTSLAFSMPIFKIRYHFELIFRISSWPCLLFRL